MKLIVLGDLDEEYFKKVLKKVKTLIKIPKSLKIYIIADVKHCNLIPVPSQGKEACRKGISFAYSNEKRSLVVVFYKKDLGTKGLIGLMLHEIMHIIQGKKLSKRLKKAFEKDYTKHFILLKALPYSEAKTKKLFRRIGRITMLLLKDLYANTELIERGLDNYLMEYFSKDLIKKPCPKPVFYEKFKRAAKKDMEIIITAFEFEFSLLSVILPFKKLKSREADKLIRYIGRHYELNIKDLARKCHELVDTYLNDFGRPNFDERFFREVFYKVFDLLE